MASKTVEAAKTAATSTVSAANALRSTAASTNLNIPFAQGKKEVYLPNHVIAMVRPFKGQSPMWAHFKVPLRWNKFDLRDYLWNAYNVPTVEIRSYLKHTPLEPIRIGPRNLMHGTRQRKPEKRMLAQLTQPFVWPEPLAKDDETRKPWAYTVVQGAKKTDEDMKKDWTRMSELRIKPIERPRPVRQPGKTEMEEKMRMVLQGGQWANQTKLDRIWDSVEKGFVRRHERAKQRFVPPVVKKQNEKTEKQAKEGVKGEDTAKVEVGEPVEEGKAEEQVKELGEKR